MDVYFRVLEQHFCRQDRTHGTVFFSLDRAFRLQHTAKRLKPATLSVLCRDASDWGLLEEEFRYVEQFFRHDLRNLNWTGHGPRRLHEGHGDRLSRRELLSEWPPFRTSV